MAKKQREKILIGRCEYIDLPELGLYNVEAKIDTGAYTSALHCESIKVINGKLCIQIFSSDKEICFDTFEKKSIKNTSGIAEERFVIKTTIILANRKIKISLSLTNRSEMKYPVLLGRKAIKGKFIVDVEKKFLW
ncbi:MAG TPA: RimK/LysX family protein [Bacteroidia bacterium]|nr:RimK/LysX family protein [Bacteroidia bacterium]